MNDNLLALDALGFTLRSTGHLMGLIIFGIVAYVAYQYGKEMGVASMLYPYAISATWALYVVGIGLCVGAFR